MKKRLSTEARQALATFCLELGIRVIRNGRLELTFDWQGQLVSYDQSEHRPIAVEAVAPPAQPVHTP